MRADKLGRNLKKGAPLTTPMPQVDEFLARAREAKVRDTIEEPVLLGRHLMDVVKPGPMMGKLLKAAYEIQLEEGITDIEELKKRVIQLL